MTAEGVVVLIVTFSGEVNVPPAGLKVGAAAWLTGTPVLIVKAASATELFENPEAVAIASIVSEADTEIGPLYTAEPAVGIVPFVV